MFGGQSEAVKAELRFCFKTQPHTNQLHDTGQILELTYLDFSFLYIKWEDLTRIVFPNLFHIVNNIYSAQWPTGRHLVAPTALGEKYLSHFLYIIIKEKIWISFIIIWISNPNFSTSGTIFQNNNDVSFLQNTHALLGSHFAAS